MAPVPIQSCVGAIANRGQWEQGCSLFMAKLLTRMHTIPCRLNLKYFEGIVPLVCFWAWPFPVFRALPFPYRPLPGFGLLFFQLKY